MAHYVTVIMLMYMGVYRETCLVYVCVYVGTFVYIKIHRWEGKYIFMQVGTKIQIKAITQVMKNQTCMQFEAGKNPMAQVNGLGRIRTSW